MPVPQGTDCTAWHLHTTAPSAPLVAAGMCNRLARLAIDVRRDLNLVSKLLRVVPRGSSGLSGALIAAAALGVTPLVQQLLAAGADANFQDGAPLLAASRGDASPRVWVQTQQARAACEHGLLADLWRGCAPLMGVFQTVTAAACGYLLASQLRPHRSPLACLVRCSICCLMPEQTLLRSAVKVGSLGMCASLQAAAHTYRSGTALTPPPPAARTHAPAAFATCCAAGDPECVRAFLDAGADPGAGDGRALRDAAAL